MEKQRPVYLDVVSLGISLPIAGKVSILHRISGIGLFICLPILLYFFQGTLSQEAEFVQFRALVAHPIIKLFLLGLLWAYLHHFCAGVRFLFLDVHKGVELETSRKTAKIVLLVSITLTIVLGALLW